MSVIEKYVKMGINSSMLFPASFEDGCAHLHGINTVCRMPQYEVIETFLSDNDEIRRMQTRVILDSGLTFNYHCPLPLQQDGGKNPCSDDLEIRKAALAYAKKHVDYAAEAGSALMVVVSPPDKGSERRVEQKKLFIEYYAQLAEYALGRGIDACLEPVERNRFKKLLLGPTSECVEFIMTMQSLGHKNAKLICDMGHLPLMEEGIKPALDLSMQIGIELIHMADAVFEPSDEFYGHTHPPFGVRRGVLSQKELAQQFIYLFECGYIPLKPGQNRPFISLEMQPYPGVSSEISAIVMYEKAESAFCAALAEMQSR